MEDLLPRLRASRFSLLPFRWAGWIAYAGAWLAAAGFWSLASAASARVSPLRALPYGLLQMGVAAAMGVAVWRLSGRVHWRTHGRSVYAIHAGALILYALLYTVTMVVPDLVRGDFGAAVHGLRTSPVLLWSVLMGSWLYLMTAGISYAIRGEREREREAAAAAEARLLAQKAHLAALRAQLNPHFLFNALHTVSALVTHDPRAADRAIDRLGELLRYAMAGEDMVPLAAEWRFVADYLAFEQLRLGDRLRVVDHLDPTAADRLVPALILQPLVENAVRHGVSARTAGGTVRADAAVEADMLVIRIADDGPGDQTREARGDGLGLASVRRRMAAVYGERGTVRIDSCADGYAVTLRIPGA